MIATISQQQGGNHMVFQSSENRCILYRWQKLRNTEVHGALQKALKQYPSVRSAKKEGCF